MGTIDLRGKKPVRKPAPRAHVERKPQLKTRRRKLRALALAGLVLVIGACAYAIHWASYLPEYQVRTILVSGESGIRPELVEAFVGTQLDTGTRPFLSPRNVLVLNGARLSRAIAGFLPRVASATVTKDSMLATAIQVTLHEREPYARWCATADDCYAMDASGYVFEHAPHPLAASTTLVFSAGMATDTPPIGQSFAAGRMGTIRTLLDALVHAGFAPPGLSVDGDDAAIPLGGFSVRTTLDQDPGDIVRNLQLVLGSDALAGKEGELDYIDLRFGNRVYFKLKGDTKETLPVL